jgi:hypothetical protein
MLVSPEDAADSLVPIPVHGPGIGIVGSLDYMIYEYLCLNITGSAGFLKGYDSAVPPEQPAVGRHFPRDAFPA